MNTPPQTANKYGHFDAGKREYVITNPETPAPWINFLIGKNLAAFISQAAGGLAFFKEPSEGRLTRYRFQGLPVDSPGFYLYVQDGKTTWNPSFFPTGTTLDYYECRHGLGYTRFRARKRDLEVSVTFTIPLDSDVLLWRVSLHNRGRRTKTITLSTYLEFSFHTFLKDILHFNGLNRQWNGTFDKKLNGIKVHYHAFQAEFMGQSILSASRPVTAFELDRNVFIGRGRTERDPVGLTTGLSSCPESQGGYLCGVLQNKIELKAGQRSGLVYTYAVSDKFAKSARLLQRFRTAGSVTKSLKKTKTFWSDALGTAQVKTPEADFDQMANTWFGYNSYVTFRFARSISLTHTGVGGALRYRDSMQDALPAPQLFPPESKQRILTILKTMLASGRTLYSVNPETLKPPDARAATLVRSDAAVWGIFTIYNYLAESGQKSFLDTVVPYFDKGTGTVWEHMVRSLKFIARNKGKDGLPLLFDVDWNDSLQIFTTTFKNAQSVMVAEQFIYAARLLIEIAEWSGRKQVVPYFRRQVALFRKAIESRAWDGAWFKRLLSKDLVMGSRTNRAGKLFLNTQTWAAIAGLDEAKTRQAMDSVHEELNTEYGLRLFRPPYRTMPGTGDTFINNPGAGENGGIFLHANVWAVIAEVMLGNAERAWQYYGQILPSRLSGKDPDRYANEPYAFSSWVHGPDHQHYGKAHIGWITGGAAWMYIIGWHYLLGIRPTLAGLLIDPHIPGWPTFRATRLWRGTLYDITVHNPHRLTRGHVRLEVDGKALKTNVIKPSRKKTAQVNAYLEEETV